MHYPKWINPFSGAYVLRKIWFQSTWFALSSNVHFRQNCQFDSMVIVPAAECQCMIVWIAPGSVVRLLFCSSPRGWVQKTPQSYIGWQLQISTKYQKMLVINLGWNWTVSIQIYPFSGTLMCESLNVPAMCVTHLGFLFVNRGEILSFSAFKVGASDSLSAGLLQ